jgi:hypothetical protein
VRAMCGGAFGALGPGLGMLSCCHQSQEPIRAILMSLR